MAVAKDEERLMKRVVEVVGEDIPFLGLDILGFFDQNQPDGVHDGKLLCIGDDSAHIDIFAVKDRLVEVAEILVDDIVFEIVGH